MATSRVQLQPLPGCQKWRISNRQPQYGSAARRQRHCAATTLGQDGELAACSASQTADVAAAVAQPIADIAARAAVAAPGPQADTATAAPLLGGASPLAAALVGGAVLAGYGLKKLYDTPSRSYDQNVGQEYDAWTEEGVLEYYWGEHIHLGYYTEEARPLWAPLCACGHRDLASAR